MLPLLLLLASLLAEPPLPPSGGEPPPAGPRIAVTIDDVPWVGPAFPGGRGKGNLRILGALQAHKVQATAFVNCDRLSADEDLLRFWTAAGMDLGNHQAAHDDPNKVSEEVWLAGVQRCHDALLARTGRTPRYFRHPYLFYGPTPAVRDRFTAALTGTFGYTVAHVSIDNYEWKYGELYGKAREAGDAARAQALVSAWIEHMREAVRHYQGVAVRKVGRDVPHVLLLHANRLNADHLGDLLRALEADGARFIPLSEALADPVYSLPNAYDGQWGISWLYRIAPVDRETPWDDGEYEEIKGRFLAPSPNVGGGE